MGPLKMNRQACPIAQAQAGACRASDPGVVEVRKLGLIGGMSWVSTAMYYEQINKGVARKMGGLSSAPLLMESVDFAPIAAMQAAGAWGELGSLMAASAR